MAWNKKGNDEKKKNLTVTVNQLYNSQGDLGSTMSLSIWGGMYNTSAVVKINPVFPKEQRKDGRVYNYDIGPNILLNAKQVRSLLHGVQVLEQEKRTDPKNCVMVFNKNTGIEVGCNGSYENEGIPKGTWYIKLFQMSDDKTEETDRIFFVPSTNDEGNVFLVSEKSEVIPIQTDFMLFREFLQNFPTLSANMKMMMLLDGEIRKYFENLLNSSGSSTSSTPPPPGPGNFRSKMVPPSSGDSNMKEVNLDKTATFQGKKVTLPPTPVKKKTELKDISEISDDLEDDLGNPKDFEDELF